MLLEQILEPKVGIEPTFPLYESGVLPLNYLGIFETNKRASFPLLLGLRFPLPRPLFNPAYVGVKASQFGQINRRLLSALFRQLPSI